MILQGEGVWQERDDQRNQYGWLRENKVVWFQAKLAKKVEVSS